MSESGNGNQKKFTHPRHARLRPDRGGSRAVPVDDPQAATSPSGPLVARASSAERRLKLQEKAAADDRKRRHAMVAFSAAAFFAVLISALSSGPTVAPPAASERADPSAPGSDARVYRFAREVGLAVNQERTRTQAQNAAFPAPSHVDLSSVAEKNVLQGLPLEGESNAYARQFPVVVHTDNSPSAEIRELVEYEHELNAWGRELREEYIRQFVAKAYRLGYQVQVDDDNTVHYRPLPQGARRPQSLERSRPSHLERLAPLCLIPPYARVGTEVSSP